MAESSNDSQAQKAKVHKLRPLTFPEQKEKDLREETRRRIIEEANKLGW